MNVPSFLKGFFLRWWEGIECYSLKTLLLGSLREQVFLG